MSLESDLFARMRPDADKLIRYGFERKENEYILERPLGNEMKAVIRIDEDLHISGSVYDAFAEEYVAFRPEGTRGEFAANVRKEYIELLEEIAEACYHPVPFASDQANRVSEFIAKEYGHAPEHIFSKFPSYAVFRMENGKWYAVIMDVSEGTFEGVNEKKEILNLRLSKETLAEKIREEGFHEAFHMNAKNWISILLDDTAGDETILALVRESYDMVSGNQKNLIRSEWIIPANPKYFDLDHAFEVSDLLYWKQSSRIQKGDLVYIYYGMPFGEIRYLCEAVETDLPFTGVNDGPVHFETMMRLRRLCFFSDHRLNRKMISGYGVTNIRGPRYMPVSLKEEIIRLYPLEEILHE